MPHWWLITPLPGFKPSHLSFPLLAGLCLAALFSGSVCRPGPGFTSDHTVRGKNVSKHHITVRQRPRKAEHLSCEVCVLWGLRVKPIHCSVRLNELKNILVRPNTTVEWTIWFLRKEKSKIKLGVFLKKIFRGRQKKNACCCEAFFFFLKKPPYRCGLFEICENPDENNALLFGAQTKRCCC